MPKLERLTEDQEFLMAEVRDKWINLALFADDEIDHDKAERGIAWMYELAKLKAPKVIYVDSPLGIQYAANILLHGKTVYDQVRDQVSGQVRGQVRDQVYGQVRDQVRDQVYDQVSDQVRDQVYDQVSGQKLDNFYWSYETLAWRADDFAWFDFFMQIGVTDHAGLKKYLDYLESGVFFAVFLNDYAIVCRRPSALRRDDQTRLHSDQEPAIEWRDGYKLWYIHGQAFDEKLWTRIITQKITLKDLMNIRNADQRTMAWSMLRPDRLLKGVKAKLIHTGQKGTRLYQVDNFSKMIGASTEAIGDTEFCMVMDDASTDRQFLEWVDPEVGKQGNADLAQASAWDIPLEDYLLMEQEA